MNDKIKWFGRYLGCGFVYRYHTGNWNKSIVGTASIMKSALPDKYECKLILKELKDISEDDLEFINQGIHHGSCIYATKNNINDIIGVIGWICLDFLRSKSYVVGIPKEYYITESEMKEDSK